MLSTEIKEATKGAHQELEKKVVLRLKAVKSNEDYAGILKCFYAYFNAVEQVIAPYVTPAVLPDLAERRNSAYLRKDIEELGGSVAQLPEAGVPKINSLAEALGAMYVMEGSIMGGPIIVQMLAKSGVTTGVSFFSGYGAETGAMWAAFVQVLNGSAQTKEERQRAIDTANDTFLRFGDLF